MVANTYEVFDAIETERRYQDIKWGAASWHEIDAYALYVVEYAHRLTRTCTDGAALQDKLNDFRKIAALCVACMEQHGAPKREFDDVA